MAGELQAGLEQAVTCVFGVRMFNMRPLVTKPEHAHATSPSRRPSSWLFKLKRTKPTRALKPPPKHAEHENSGPLPYISADP